jgi:hypothetical protein
MARDGRWQRRAIGAGQCSLRVMQYVSDRAPCHRNALCGVVWCCAQCGMTAFLFACLDGHLDVARWLVTEAGCDVGSLVERSIAVR